MKKTYTTKMPDKVGAFEKASKIISSLGLNITRVSYNKAVDIHFLFIEVEGENEAIEKATTLLNSAGYIVNDTTVGNIMLINFILPDTPGSLYPVLRLINHYNFNISYISSQADGTAFQNFRMGFMIESQNDVSEFLKQVSTICEFKIVSYTPCEQTLDNTVFYLTFANWISKRINLSANQKLELIVQSNLIMELLRDRPKAQYDTFDYIRRFAEKLYCYHDSDFKSRISKHQINNRIEIILIEPPCGSNICLLKSYDKILCVDGGFYCYSKEAMKIIYDMIPDFDSCDNIMVLTHADVDHCGISYYFDKIFTSYTCKENFCNENKGLDNLREQNPIHSPYVHISKLLSKYQTISQSKLKVIGNREIISSEPLSFIGNLGFDSLNFEVYEGFGGHVRGEIILIEKTHRIAFTGDIFINVKDCIPEQKDFNLLAPYLMMSVDTLPQEAKREREKLSQLLSRGQWRIFGGHGNMLNLNID